MRQTRRLGRPQGVACSSSGDSPAFRLAAPDGQALLAAGERSRGIMRKDRAMSGDSGGWHTEPNRALVNGPSFDLVDDCTAATFRRRRVVPGREAELVDGFLSGFRPRASESLRVSVFREPALPSGFPDLVAVTWREPVSATCLEHRGLSLDDLRLLHILWTHAPVDAAWLERLNFSRPTAMLARLNALGMAVSQGRRWRTTPLRQFFAVRSITAFEAKISDWSGALEQAGANRWFASESFILAPKVPRDPRVFDEARRIGVGIWVGGVQKPVLRAPRARVRQPVSFASWLFNQWVCEVASGKSADRALPRDTHAAVPRLESPE